MHYSDEPKQEIVITGNILQAMSFLIDVGTQYSCT